MCQAAWRRHIPRFKNLDENLSNFDSIFELLSDFLRDSALPVGLQSWVWLNYF